MSRVDLDAQGLFFVLEAPEGPVGEDLTRRAQEVLAQATTNAEGAQVPGAMNAQGRGPRIRTGNLSTSLRYTIETDSGLHAEVGSDVFYSTYLETGFMGGWNHDIPLKFPFLVPALIQLGYTPIVAPS